MVPAENESLKALVKTGVAGNGGDGGPAVQDEAAEGFVGQREMQESQAGFTRGEGEQSDAYDEIFPAVRAPPSEEADECWNDVSVGDGGSPEVRRSMR